MYKRQSLRFILISSLRFIGSSLYTVFCLKGCLPVSYTHLDVYKRQPETLWLNFFKELDSAPSPTPPLLTGAVAAFNRLRDSESAQLTIVLKNLTVERAELANGVDKEHPALVAFMRYQNIDRLTRDILVELVDHIKVYENGNISIRFKFADEFRKILEYIELNTDTPAKVV